MAEFDCIAALRDLVTQERTRIVRQWSKRLRAQSQEVEVPGADLREPLGSMLDELARLLEQRGAEALELWPEAVRSHGVRRYEQRFDADDLIREFKILQEVLLHVYGRRRGVIETEFAETVAELIGEATASVEASFTRVLRTEEVRFRDAAVMESVLHHLDVGILVVELDGTVSFVTPPVARLIGVPIRLLAGARSNQVLGAVLAQIGARHPTGEPFRFNDMPFVEALRERRAVRNVSMLVQGTDGAERTLELSATPIFAEPQEGEGEGDLLGVIQTMADRTETAIKNRELGHAYEELRRLQGRLLQRTRTQALGQLASGAAHALNNFLNVLRLRITLLRREFKPEHLDALDKTVRNIGDLIARLQEFSVTRAEEQLTNSPFDQVVAEALQLARPDLDAEEAGVAVDSSLRGDGFVRVDAGFFRELVVNLLLAARRRVEHEGKVEIASSRDGSWLQLRVRDSGKPYGEEELSQLFDPLKSRFRPQDSLLLGVARNQVQRWGGELEAHNVEGGAEFVLRLPAVQEQRKEEEPRRERPPRRVAQARRVLVVDDDPDNAGMMAEVLSDEGYQVRVAQSGREALQVWDQGPFDAALLDVMMPDISGWELARTLRARSGDVLLAAVTGADVRGQNRSNLALVDAVFRKPVDVEALDDFLSQREHHAADEEEEKKPPEERKVPVLPPGSH